MLSNIEPAVHPFQLAPSLSSSAAQIYDVLRQVGELVKAHRGYHAKTSQVTFFCPAEIVAMAAGVSRRTLYYKLAELRSSGLIAQKGHFCTHNGSTRSDGSLWAVRLAEGNGPIVIDHDWLKKSYRNLGKDIVEGKTAWNLAQSYFREEKLVDIEDILSYAIPATLESITDDCARDFRGQLEEMLDLPYVAREGINKAVDNAAMTITRQVGAVDTSVMFYRWLLWNLLRLEKQNKSYFYQVFLMIQRAKVDREENACINASGLFVSRLKQSQIWHELRAVKHTRVGVNPSTNINTKIVWH